MSDLHREAFAALVADGYSYAIATTIATNESCYGVEHMLRGQRDVTIEALQQTGRNPALLAKLQRLHAQSPEITVPPHALALR